MNGSVRTGAALPQAGRATSSCSTSRTRSTAGGCARPASACSRRSGSRTGRSAGAVDRTEWVSQIRTATTIFGPYQLQEASHASYWGQLAMRNCLRLAYNGGAVRGGRCVRVANGLNAAGEPQMGLQ